MPTNPGGWPPDVDHTTCALGDRIDIHMLVVLIEIHLQPSHFQYSCLDEAISCE